MVLMAFLSTLPVQLAALLYVNFILGFTKFELGLLK